jgi:hypothetical protein
MQHFARELRVERANSTECSKFVEMAEIVTFFYFF